MKKITATLKENRRKNIAAKILVIFGTRPEAIKLAPVIQELKKASHFETLIFSSSQHKGLLQPFLEIFDIKPHYDLKVMKKNQTPNKVLAKTIKALDKILEEEKPDLILVQGDTTTALAGALAGFNQQIAVGHIEAGLRTGNLQSPFPEEFNRKIVSQTATLHFTATSENRDNLLKEHVPENQIFVTGNPIIDALHKIRKNLEPSEKIENLVKETADQKRLLLTTHRRESFGKKMRANLEVIRKFIEERKDTCLMFPVHLNPNVKKITEEVLADCDRIHLLEPLDYKDFIYLMENSWLIVSDSGGVQEEAPTLGKPVLVLRENTERPESIMCGIAKLVGGDSRRLARMLENNYLAETWINSVKQIQNPFGNGNSASQIVKILTALSS